ncbi:hypothetical protein DFH09DRAFT_1312008 [Mycena vulgaris]|nr:hypothetical protein DFH09DRAFT_1312008 [Mycena vulgaris]
MSFSFTLNQAPNSSAYIAVYSAPIQFHSPAAPTPTPTTSVPPTAPAQPSAGVDIPVIRRLAAAIRRALSVLLDRVRRDA